MSAKVETAYLRTYRTGYKNMVMRMFVYLVLSGTGCDGMCNGSVRCPVEA